MVESIILCGSANVGKTSALVSAIGLLSHNSKYNLVDRWAATTRQNSKKPRDEIAIFQNKTTKAYITVISRGDTIASIQSQHQKMRKLLRKHSIDPDCVAIRYLLAAHPHGATILEQLSQTNRPYSETLLIFKPPFDLLGETMTNANQNLASQLLDLTQKYGW